jgi:hypothetical protein
MSRPPNSFVYATGWTSAAVLSIRAKKEPPMADTPPDRLSVNPKSPHYDEAVLSRGVGIRFRGEEKTTVEEYCVSEGWVRLAVGTTKDRKGNPLTIKMQGPVEPYFQDPEPQEAARDAPNSGE